MPIMSSQNDDALPQSNHSLSSPNSQSFVDHHNSTSESPSTRKRKQEEFNYSTEQSVLVDLPFYSQQWKPTPSLFDARTLRSSDIISLNETNIHASSDLLKTPSCWNHFGNESQNTDTSFSNMRQHQGCNSSTIMMGRESPLIQENNHSISTNTTEVVSEDKGGFSEIQSMLSFDPFQSQLPSSTNQIDRNTTRQEPSLNLHLNDLETESIYQERQQFVQSWNSSGSNQIRYTSGGGSDTPTFFTPGFLESLQEDEPYSASSFPYHTNKENNWGRSSPPGSFTKNSSIDHYAMAVLPEETVESQNDKSVSSFAHRFYVAQQNECSSVLPSPSSPSDPTVSVSNKLSLSPSTPSPSIITTGISSTGSLNCITDIGDRHRLTEHLRKSLQKYVISEAKIKLIIQDYLSNYFSKEERTVIVLTSKVAQKSYGTEKRFLCPPPTAILVGTHWWTPSSAQQKEHTGETLRLPDGVELSPPKVTVSISGDTSSQAGQIEWYTVSRATVGQTGQRPTTASGTSTNGSPSQQHPSRFRSSAESRNNNINWYHNPSQELLVAGKCVSKHLYINDADERRKRVEALVRIQLANGVQLGLLASKGIKVISKPSKKRQSVKNMELCIHHGTTVSLFNRIRSQTVSTKYLGVSSPSSSSSFPGQSFDMKTAMPNDTNTCFVARTTCWDPFVIWIVDTSITRERSYSEDNSAKDFIGRNTTQDAAAPYYPPPPAIALKNKTSQLMPIHYNQHVVLQCLTTGLVSPVMIIRKVDKASTVVGGAQQSIVTDDPYLSGDEVLGDPISQLHKVALQIVQQQGDMIASSSTQQLSTYLACLNDMVGMHKTTEPRKPIINLSSTTSSSSSSSSSAGILVSPPLHTALASSWDEIDVTSQELGGKVVRKRRVSTEHSKMFEPSYLVNDDSNFYHHASARQHQPPEFARKSSVSSHGSIGGGRRTSASSGNQAISASLGAYWYEDVSDAAVWTIVGTDCAAYTFLSPITNGDSEYHDKTSSRMFSTPANSSAAFPVLTNFTTKTSTKESQQQQLLALHGENFSRDLQVWFGNVKSNGAEYRSRELILCKVPSKHELMTVESLYGQVPILFVKGDGTICKTNKFYSLV
ncbi:MAG: hypothetical protein EXX96DRAFT_581940 [Benjaminiella poitrasii]|nr:MAG: hypothetical protein EXX96DRAFT_581940 [Benjaminiella poitrasii]